MKTTHLLIPLGLVLGVLVWLDNSGPDSSGDADSQVVRAVERAPRAAEQIADRPEADRPSPASAAAVANPLAAVDKETLRATVDRPLFAPQRSRPPVVAEQHVEAAPPPPPPPLPTYALLGVVTHEGRAIALLSRTEDGTSFRVEQGETIGGWQVASVGSKSVSLVGQDGTTVTVPLTVSRPKSQPVPEANGIE